MAPAEAHQISMGNHLTLELLRTGQAEKYHLGSMGRAAFLAFYLCEAGYGVSRDGLFQDTDETLSCCHQAALDTGVWRVDDDAYALLCEVLTLHDTQLAVAPMYQLTLANESLQRMVAKV